jgi:hypothetical protein
VSIFQVSVALVVWRALLFPTFTAGVVTQNANMPWLWRGGLGSEEEEEEIVPL